MSTIRITIDSREAREAFLGAPEAMERHLGEGLDLAAEIIAREARRLASQRDVTGNLSESIRVEAPEALAREVVSNADHARYVEEGTGVFAGRAPYRPNPEALLAYLRAHRIARGFTFEGARRRGSQERQLRDRAQAMARAIARAGGTRPYPFMAPAAERAEARVRQVVEAAVARGLEEIGDGR